MGKAAKAGAGLGQSWGRPAVLIFGKNLLSKQWEKRLGLGQSWGRPAVSIFEKKADSATAVAEGGPFGPLWLSGPIGPLVARLPLRGS